MGHQIIPKYLGLWYLTPQLEYRTTVPMDDSMSMHCPQCECSCILMAHCIATEWCWSSICNIFTGSAYSKRRVLNFYKNFPFLTLSTSSSHLVALISRLGKDLVCFEFILWFLCTYRHFIPVKLEDGSQHKNLRVFSVSTGEELISFTQKSQESWDLQYTISESHAIRLVSSDIQVFRPAEWSKGIVDKLRVEGATSISLSPGLNPSVAVFVAEKKVDLFAILLFLEQFLTSWIGCTS